MSTGNGRGTASIQSRQLAIIAAVTRSVSDGDDDDMSSPAHIPRTTVTEQRAADLHTRGWKLYDYRDKVYDQRAELHDLRLQYTFDQAVARRIDAALHVLGRRIDAVNAFIDLMIAVERRYHDAPEEWTSLDIRANNLLEQMKVTWSKWPAYGRAEVMSPAPMPRLTMTTSNGTLMLVPIAETKVL